MPPSTTETMLPRRARSFASRLAGGPMAAAADDDDAPMRAPTVSFSRIFSIIISPNVRLYSREFTPLHFACHIFP